MRNTDNKKLAEYLGGRLKWDVSQLEKYLNEFQQPKFDYEIISVRERDNNDNIIECKYRGMFNPDYYEIHSVKRLSDNKVFTIDDDTNCGIIKEFKIVDQDNKLKVEFQFNFKWLHVLQHKNKQSLFTTEDNVKIYEDYEGEIFRVFLSNSSFESWKVYNLGMPQFPNKDEKYFVSEEAANNFVLMNKPCLSVNDICATYAIFHDTSERLKELAKQKING